MLSYQASGSDLWILGVLGVGGGGLIMFIGALALSRMVASRHWPTVQGRIIASSLGSTSPREKGGVIKYDYTVEGRRYIAEGVGFGAMWLGGGISSLITVWRIRQLIERYPVGRAVTVIYDPRRPGVSALERWRGVVDTVGFVLFGAVLFLVGTRMFSW